MRDIARGFQGGFRRFVPALVLFLGAAFVWNSHRQRNVPLAGSLTTILDSMPGYVVRDQTLSDDERRVAGMSDYVARVYVKDSLAAFTTFVSYYESQAQGKTIHSPKNCLPGAGWEIVSPGVAQLAVNGRSVDVNKVVLKNGRSVAVVYYWYQGRGRVVANEFRVKANLLRDAAFAGHTEEALVRVVVPVKPGPEALDSPEAQQRMAEATALGAEIAAKLQGEVARVLPKAS